MQCSKLLIFGPWQAVYLLSYATLLYHYFFSIFFCFVFKMQYLLDAGVKQAKEE
jgi:hypothetical protein